VEDRDLIFIYCTFPDLESAKKLSYHLLEEKLIACANILSPSISLYFWEGKIENSDEVPVIWKTSKTKRDEIQDVVHNLHPFSIPCILYWEISGGNAPYINWLKDSINL
jgi:periplasmic divalent cation tolerance protein